MFLGKSKSFRWTTYKWSFYFCHRLRRSNFLQLSQSLINVASYVGIMQQFTNTHQRLKNQYCTTRNYYKVSSKQHNFISSCGVNSFISNKKAIFEKKHMSTHGTRIHFLKGTKILKIFLNGFWMFIDRFFLRDHKKFLRRDARDKHLFLYFFSFFVGWLASLSLSFLGLYCPFKNSLEGHNLNKAKTKICRRKFYI